MIIIKNLKKSYGDVEVLKGISVSFDRTGLYGIVGPNGSGKTTLMKCILGFLDYQGEIELKNDKYRDSISYLPEIITTYPFLTGKEIIELLCEIQDKNFDRIWSNVNLLAQDLNYSDFDKLTSEHSKGNLRKLFLIYALGVEAKFVFLDEPFAGLDPVSVELLKKTLVLHKESSLIVMNTHFFDSAKEICDWIFFMKNGNILKKANKEQTKKINVVELYGRE